MNTDYTMTAEAAEKTGTTGISPLNKLFRKILFTRLKGLESGELTISEKGQTYIFGSTGSHELKASVKINNPAAYSMIMFGGDVGAAKAYILGYWVTDNLVALTQLFIRNKEFLTGMDRGLGFLKKPAALVQNIMNRNTREGSKRNISAHYDLSNDFYQLFLDDTMNYSSGIFTSESSSMEEASIEKMDRICKKLDLKPEDHLLEIGSGWGGMAVHAAKHFGCKVTTTTISKEQHRYVKDLIKKENLGNQITLLNKDYRDLTGIYDKLVSVEMIEAVGFAYIPEFFKVCDRLLKEDGLMVLQGITVNEQHFKHYRKSADFIERYIFPGSSLISVSHILETIRKRTTMNLVNMEDITPHYAETLKEWRIAFNKNIEKVKNLGFSGQFIRMWEYYFCACEGGFRERHIGDMQMTFAKRENRRESILGTLL